MTTFTSDNMELFLGSDYNDHEAQSFGEYLESRGWKLELDSDGQFHAYRDGAEMTETEWQTVLDAYPPKSIEMWEYLTGDTTPSGNALSEWRLQESPTEGEINHAWYILPDGYSSGDDVFGYPSIIDSRSYLVRLSTVDGKPIIMTENGELPLIRDPWLMNQHTGTVQLRSEWLGDYESSSDDEWGGHCFDDADLTEVVPNVRGTVGYDSNAGEWREV